MAIYKVPQDVEAEDKLIGPLSFRQFVYAGIALGGCLVAYVLFRIFPLLAIVPIPIIILFGTLALPLRKDQPMETYLLAILRFYLKPKMRVWNPDGTITYVEITAPKIIEPHLTKEFGGESAQERLDYLARIMDTRGWSSKKVLEPTNSVSPDVAAEAQTLNDVMDENASLSKNINNLISKNNKQLIDNAREQMTQAATQPTTEQEPPASAQVLTTAPQPTTPKVHYQPYPQMHQKVVHTMAEQQEISKALSEAQAEAKPSKPVPKQVSPDIMRLAKSEGLSISAIANEAHRLKDKEEVVIKLH